ncbi:MAG: phenylalanine--tRNA ligase subunit alpha [Dehalococcoidia bacterium]|nr:phenylalanine--tRNA ligase subunit alpha [Dehalococcoidia bacterium]
MIEKLDEIKSNAIDELSSLQSIKELEDWRVRYLGKKSALTQILRGLASRPLEERKAVGASANELKSLLERSHRQKKEALKEKAYQEMEAAAVGKQIISPTGIPSEEKFGIPTVFLGIPDVTLPGRPIPLGRLHPTTQMVREICDIFVALGFQVVEGPEVEWDYYNFEALNIPPDHPARDMWATLWIDTKSGERPMLLRTHTSPMQIRVMERTTPPVRVVVPGKVYRYEATDATHESMFYQIEGLAVDKNITLADLKGTLYEFARRLFGAERKVRFRCDYFPFVEPGVEMAIDCMVCGGTGCRLCSGTGWIEILGAGMVHPAVLRRVNYDPEIYTGFAFGLGLERMSMLRYGVEDIRLFYSNDLRFLRQF